MVDGAWVGVQMGEQEDGDKALAAEVAVLDQRLQLRALAVLQDCCDGLLALTDVRGRSEEPRKPPWYSLLGPTCVYLADCPTAAPAARLVTWS